MAFLLLLYHRFLFYKKLSDIWQMFTSSTVFFLLLFPPFLFSPLEKQKEFVCRRHFVGPEGNTDFFLNNFEWLDSFFLSLVKIFNSNQSQLISSFLQTTFSFVRVVTMTKFLYLLCFSSFVDRETCELVILEQISATFCPLKLVTNCLEIWWCLTRFSGDFERVCSWGENCGIKASGSPPLLSSSSFFFHVLAKTQSITAPLDCS